MKQLSLVALGLLLCFLSFAQEKWVGDYHHSNVRFEVGRIKIIIIKNEIIKR